MIQWGINALNHGSSLAVFKDGDFKGDRISTSDDTITPDHYDHFLKLYGTPDRIFWYENPWLKKARQVYAGQYATALDMSVLPKRKLKEWGLGNIPVTYTPHHASHAAAGYYTSPFNHCAIVVLDAIGEFECATIWEARYGEMKKVWSAKYPHSLGLFYSAFTKMLGLTPIRDEYLLQKMAEQGDPKRFRNDLSVYFKPGPVELDYNFHRGVLNWSPEPTSVQEQCDIAAAVQERFEMEIYKVMYKAKTLTNADCLVYMGGCAMNSAANRRFVEPEFKYIWSLPNPGDPSSSMGAVLYHTKQRIRNDWAPVKHIAINV
jgi:carbamoyltransferase